MGTFRVPVQVGDPQGSRFEAVEALVDTGATYTVLPAPLLDRLGIRPDEKRQFELADDRVIELDVGMAQIRINGNTYLNIVVFAEEATEPMIGAATLETFGLAVDPTRKRLVKVPGLLK